MHFFLHKMDKISWRWTNIVENAVLNNNYDFLEFFAEIDLLGGLSACPGGDCSASHSSEEAQCYPLQVDVFKAAVLPEGWSPAELNSYSRTHGL